MMSHDDNPVNFLSDIQPSERIGTLIELKPKVSDYSIVFPPSSPNTQPVFTIALKFSNLPLPLINWY